MKKGDTVNKAEEFLYQLSLKPKCAEVLETFRTMAKLPLNGLNENESWKTEWERLIKDQNIAVHLLSFSELIQWKFNVPEAYAPFIRLYLCFGFIPKEFNEIEVVKICLPTHLVDKKKDDIENDMRVYFHYEPFARLLIPARSSKSEVLEFIKENWNEVEDVWRQQGWQPQKRIRQSIYKKRNLRIKELWRKTTKELQELDNSTTADRDLIIRSILKAENYGEVDDGYIRKMGAGNKIKSPRNSRK